MTLDSNLRRNIQKRQSRAWKERGDSFSEAAAERCRSIKIVIWRLLSHSNFGVAGFRTTNPIVRRKKFKAMLQSRLFEDSLR